MIIGLGCDIIEISRIRKAIERHKNKIIEHLFTPFEMEHALRFTDPSFHFAGRFAAKEAVLKALGTGLSGNLSWHDIEIRNDPKGKPEVFLSEALKKRVPSGIFHLSISHSKEYAMATAIIEKAS